MKIKHFVVYSLIYIGLVAAVTFMVNPSSYEVGLMGIRVRLPVAIWFVLPLLFIVILSILHVGYYGLKTASARYAIKNDMEIYDTYAKEILLGVESDKKFKTSTFKTANEVTKYLSPWHENEPNLQDPDITEIINILNLINAGEVVDLKKFRLKSDNPVVLKNEQNKLRKDPSYASEILKNRSSLDNDLEKSAYKAVLENAKYFDIKKYDFEKSKFDIRLLVSRYANDESFEMTKDDLIALLSSAEFSEAEYIDMAKELTTRLEPDTLVAIFDRLKDKKQDAGEAYLYLLYEFGMIEELREKLLYSDGEDHDKFETLIFLRDHGKNVPASYFF